MLMPRKVKYRKHQRGNLKGFALTGNKISFGECGLRALEHAWITARQIEAARLAIARYLKQKGKLWIRIFPDKSVTENPAEARMGKGKGDVVMWVAPVKPGRILFEVGGVPIEEAKEALRLAASKLPLKTNFAIRTE